VNQYDNPCNPGAYSPFASQLVEELGHIDCLVGSVGSGGSMCGTARYLRELFPELVAIGVDTHGSVLFGQPDGPRPLRGLGNSLLPANLDHQVFDEVHWVTCAEAYLATRRLHRETALFCGGTSGAAWMVAADWARRHPRARVVCIFPDDGFRYTETIYNDAHLAASGLLLDTLPEGPREVLTPTDAGPGWSFLRWGRRTYADVMGHAPAEMSAVRA
jgi:cysteine synthase A